MKHPLDEQFDIVDGYMEDLGTVEIPDNPDLDTIINLSLSAYKEQMEVISLVEPKNRTKYLEIAERFLNQAKDAMAKKEQLKINYQKMALVQKDKTKKLESHDVDGEVVDRKSLYELKKIKG
jgi:hypothetical protein